MKKVTLVLVLFLSAFLFTGCTDNSEDLIESTSQKEKRIESGFYENQIDPAKDCPQNDRNCNGVPDDKE